MAITLFSELQSVVTRCSRFEISLQQLLQINRSAADNPLTPTIGVTLLDLTDFGQIIPTLLRNNQYDVLDFSNVAHQFVETLHRRS